MIRTIAIRTLIVACTVIGASVIPASAAQRNIAGHSTTTLMASSSKGGAVPLSALTELHLNATANAGEPSGVSPPGAHSLSGYDLSYVTDFAGTSLPFGWTDFNGTPGSDPSSRWASSHVVVSGGLLQLNTWQDPAYNNLWVSGGVCQCGVVRTYGAYFVRSKLTGPGPTQVELLWPSSGWPPEVDFIETSGGAGDTVATLHYDGANNQVCRRLATDMTQWHTWGVTWTPTSITYIVDGTVWGTIKIAGQIPSVPMTLDITQQTWCSAGWACPTSPQSTLVDWVAEYSKSAIGPATRGPGIERSVTVGPFAVKTAALSRTLMAQLVSLAAQIKRSGVTKVDLVGYGDKSGPPAWSRHLGRVRARIVKSYLKRRLAELGVSGVSMRVVGLSKNHLMKAQTTQGGMAKVGDVVASIS